MVHRPEHWQFLSLSEHRFLAPLADLFDCELVENFTLAPEREFSRIECSGIVTLRGLVGGRTVGVIFNDFRLNGGSFGKEGSRRVCAFLEALDSVGAPLVFVFSTLGVRIMEGRTVARDAFSVIPALKRFASRNLVLTVAAGRCLGLGALLYGFGHYRMAIRGEGLLSLAGPEVMRMFFGAKVNFDDIAGVERHFQNGSMIHELLSSRRMSFRRARQLLKYPLADEGVAFPETISASPSIRRSDARLAELLGRVGTDAVELLGQLPGVVRAYLVRREGKALGVVINPPGNTNNMVNVATLRKYSAALDLFRAMGVPAISLLDAPGIDPRVEQMDRDILKAVLDTASRIIDYPHGLMGIVVGRCYGGSSTLGFPKFFGSLRVVALKGSQVGIMHESIIEQLFAGSPRLLEDWNRATETESADLEDMCRDGLIDAVIDEREIGVEVDKFLALVPVALDVKKLVQGTQTIRALRAASVAKMTSRNTTMPASTSTT